MPQEWNDDGKYGPERYIEAHIWSDKVIQKYKIIWRKSVARTVEITLDRNQKGE